jgi:hypothetical protein
MEGLRAYFASRAGAPRPRVPVRTLLFLGVAMFGALILPQLREMVISFAARIYWLSNGLHKDDPLLDYLIGWAYALGVLVSIYLWPIPKAHKGLLQKFWLLRCLITLGMMLVYENFYSLDAFEYFHESRFEEFRWKVNLNDNWSTLAYLSWFVQQYIVLGDSYHGAKVMFSLLGMLGSYLLYLGAMKHMRGDTKWLFVLLQVLPSMLFWSSILGKDPVNFFAICLYAYGVLSWIAREPDESVIVHFLAITGGVVTAFIIRPWTGQILAIPLVLVALLKVRMLAVRFAAMLALPYFLHNQMGMALAKFGISSATDLLAMVNAVSRSWSRGGSGQAPPVFYNITDLFAFAPLGMFTALFRPLPGEIMNPFGLLAGIENLVMLTLVLAGIKKKVSNWSQTSAKDKAVLLWVSCTIFGWSFLYAFISYQNLGAAFRFRLQIMPMLILLAIFLNKKTEDGNLLGKSSRANHDPDQAR